MVAVKLDENLPDAVADVLGAAGHDVALVRDQGLAGSDDSRLLEVAVAEGRVLVTLDLDFGDILRHPPAQTAGIVVLRLHSQTLSLMGGCAIALARLLDLEPVVGRLWVLDETRLRVWPSARPG